MRNLKLKLPTTFLFCSLVALFVFIFINSPTASKEDTTQTIDLSFSNNAVEDILSNVGMSSVAIFLYANNYQTRYVLAADTEIVNPFSIVKGDSYFEYLLKRNQAGVCTVEQTTSIYKDSSLYEALQSTDRISDNLFYMACPLYTSDGYLMGYVSVVVNRANIGLVENYLDLKFYSYQISKDLEQLL